MGRLQILFSFGVDGPLDAGVFGLVDRGEQVKVALAAFLFPVRGQFGASMDDGRREDALAGLWTEIRGPTHVFRTEDELGPAVNGLSLVFSRAKRRRVEPGRLVMDMDMDGTVDLYLMV